MSGPEIGLPAPGTGSVGYIPSPVPIPVPPLTPSPPQPGPPTIPEPVPIPVPGEGEGHGEGGTGTPAPLPPVVPEAGTDEALPGLGTLSFLIVLLGLIALASTLIEALNNLFRWMLGPLWSRLGSRQATGPQFTQWLSGSLGSAYSGVDAQIGKSFQQLAGTTSRTGSAIVAGAQLAYRLAQRVNALEGGQTGNKHAAANAAAQAQAAQAAAASAATAAAAVGVNATAREGQLQARIDALQTHITTILEPELDGLRHRIPQLERGTAHLWDEVKQHSEALSIAGVTAATAAALGRLGGGWIRCESNQLVGEALCGSDNNMLKNLLNGLLDAMVIADLCEIVDLLGEGATLGGDFIGFITGAVEGLISCQGADKAPALKTRYYAPPASAGLVTL